MAVNLTFVFIYNFHGSNEVRAASIRFSSELSLHWTGILYSVFACIFHLLFSVQSVDIECLSVLFAVTASVNTFVCASCAREKMQSFLLAKVCVIVFVLTFARFTSTQNVNDDCVMEGTGAAGTCVLLQNCVSALEDIAKNSLYPTNCGYQNGEQIVCCPTLPTAKPPSAPATRISEKSK